MIQEDKILDNAMADDQATTHLNGEHEISESEFEQVNRTSIVSETSNTFKTPPSDEIENSNSDNVSKEPTPFPDDGSRNGQVVETISDTPIIEQTSVTESEIPSGGVLTDSEIASIPNSPNQSRVRSTTAASLSSIVDTQHFFVKSFEVILNMKEVQKDQNLQAIIKTGSSAAANPSPDSPKLILSTLTAMCSERSGNLKVKAIGLFVKLFDHCNAVEYDEITYIADESVDSISSCFDGEGTDSEIELQVVRALLHCILTMPCHGASLLKAVRQIYNIFIFSLDVRNQSVAQGILTQVINAIFSRVGEVPSIKNKRRVSILADTKSLKNSDQDLGKQNPSEEKLTLENLEKLNFESNDLDRVKEANNSSENDEDVAVKDVFLVFRAMCKLSVKPLEADSIDMRSHAVRSKLLSLNIIHNILSEHIEIFLNPEIVILSSKSAEKISLTDAIRQYLCLTLSRNSASPLAPVFELSIEIFWLVISNLRAEFKREIPLFWDEIYFPIAELKTSTPHQKRYLLSIVERICNDSRCILEFYLNYDCNNFMPNVCEKLIDYLTRLALMRVDVTVQQKIAYFENQRKGISIFNIGKAANLTSNALSSRPPEPEVYHKFPVEFALKVTAIGCIVAFLRSLYSWAQKDYHVKSVAPLSSSEGHGIHIDTERNRSSTVDSNHSASYESRNGSFVNGTHLTENTSESDDPEQFETLKQRKKSFLEGVKQFSIKPKKGIDHFLKHNFIASDSPNDIASFLLNTDGLNKTAIGDYLGEASEKNIQIMHAFVDQLNFSNTEFVDALRIFLQAFRLPGEAQKIDRFMLKFAERYVLGNPTVFVNADSAYVLAYSVILLNTDLHSPQVKNRMTFEDFCSNNKGIDDGNDLPVDFLNNIYNKISVNEIKLQSEQHAALIAGDINLSQSSSSLGFFGGRDANLEAYLHVSKELSTKTEKLVKDLSKKSRNADSAGSFFVASHVYHVKSIFDTLWMSILAGLTSPFKEYDDEIITNTSLEGIKLSTKIACTFNLDYARTSFIGALVQFQNLFNFEEMKPKNIDACYVMLEIAVTNANTLRSAWEQVAMSMSQLERLQLISQGINQDTIPDLSSAKLVTRASVDSVSSSGRGFFGFAPHQSAAQIASNKFHNQRMSPEIAELLSKTELEVAIDKVFTNSANISGEAIADFVRAASKIAAEEIESSGQNRNPRMFMLQKLVDICYYNMSRIRLEWSQLWSIMGATFKEVCCHSNVIVVFFSLDSLRQLSMRFLDIEELSHFKFQKEFLQPFEHAMIHNDSLEIKDMVLECLNNLILAKAENIRSGWKAIFNVLIAAAKENMETLVTKTYKIACAVSKNYKDEVSSQDSFTGMVECFTQLVKNQRFQKISLLSLDLLRDLGQEMHESAVKHKKFSQTEIERNLSMNWVPILFSFHDIIMNGEELEVRSRALSYLFDILFKNGSEFSNEFWNRLCVELLFPMFNILGNHWDLNDSNDDDTLSVWLSTTLIQALRNMITLFSHFFEVLNPSLDGYLNLLISSICQENDTIARIGRSCLYSLLIDNANKFSSDDWEKIVKAFANLFSLTSAKELFSLDPLKSKDLQEDDQDVTTFDMASIDSNDNSKLENPSLLDETRDRLQKSKEKSSIVVKCVIQLLMIETLSEIFDNDTFYEAIPYKYLNELAQLLRNSYYFARNFNDDYNLRVRLWNAGVIERLPNLLKQESGSSAVYINIMFRMYCDDSKTELAAKKDIIDSLIPLCVEITDRFSDMDESNQHRNISTWRPVIVELYQGYIELDEHDFVTYAPRMYKATLYLLSRSLTSELRQAIRTFLARIGDTYLVSPVKPS